MNSESLWQLKENDEAKLITLYRCQHVHAVCLLLIFTLPPRTVMKVRYCFGMELAFLIDCAFVDY